MSKLKTIHTTCCNCNTNVTEMQVRLSEDGLDYEEWYPVWNEEHICESCRESFCEDCSRYCDGCGHIFCLDCLTVIDEEHFCEECKGEM